MTSFAGFAGEDEERGAGDQPEVVRVPSRGRRTRRKVAEVTANSSSSTVSSSDQSSDLCVRINLDESPSSSGLSEDKTPLPKTSGLIPLGPPTTSFIHPPKASASSRPSSNLKCDPVRLYQHYEAIWAKTKFPGDGSDKQVRWAVREWMMGDKR